MFPYFKFNQSIRHSTAHSPKSTPHHTTQQNTHPTVISKLAASQNAFLPYLGRYSSVYDVSFVMSWGLQPSSDTDIVQPASQPVLALNVFPLRANGNNLLVISFIEDVEYKRVEQRDYQQSHWFCPLQVYFVNMLGQYYYLGYHFSLWLASI